MKQINKILNNYQLNIKKLLILFIIIQPIFDLKIFYNSISTLIRVIFISLFFLYYFCYSKNSEKYYLLIYPLLIVIYFILHNLNALSFHSLVPGDFNYSPFHEFLYCVKMICPFMLIYSIYKANLSKKEIEFIITAIILFISTIIIFSNIFLFSYGSYSDVKIKANFMEWFNLNSQYNYKDLASKGLFEFANQVSAVLLMFLPFMIYQNLKSENRLNLLTLIFNLIALILLCTKVAVLGIALAFIYTLFLYLISEKSGKNISTIAVVFILYIIILPFNPSFSRMQERKEIIQAASSAPINVPIDEFQLIEEKPFYNLDDNLTDTYKLKFIEQNYKEQKINENFIMNRYPYIYDIDFWYDILVSNNNNKSDYRFLEQSMVKRVVNINNNKLDILFGITYTRVQNIFNIEKDFIMQYYSTGIIGVILFFGPYFIILAFYFIKILLNKFKNVNILNFICYVSILMIFAVSYYSGNLLNSLSFTIYFAIIFAIILRKHSN